MNVDVLNKRIVATASGYIYSGQHMFTLVVATISISIRALNIILSQINNFEAFDNV